MAAVDGIAQLGADVRVGSLHGPVLDDLPDRGVVRRSIVMDGRQVTIAGIQNGELRGSADRLASLERDERLRHLLLVAQLRLRLFQRQLSAATDTVPLQRGLVPKLLLGDGDAAVGDILVQQTLGLIYGVLQVVEGIDILIPAIEVTPYFVFDNHACLLSFNGESRAFCGSTLLRLPQPQIRWAEWRLSASN